MGRFLDAATACWRRLERPFDAAARRAVESLCAQAADLVRAGETEAARRLLSRAAEMNGAARSPLVGQYVANLAVVKKNLFLAVQAQIEALRLAPENALYRRNLRILLTVPYKEFIDHE